MTKTLRMQIVWDVLESAKDNGDQFVVSHCRNLINLNRVGKWDSASFAIVLAFA